MLIALSLITFGSRILLLIFAAILFALLLDGLTNLIIKYLKPGRNWAFFIAVLSLLLFTALLFWFTGAPIYDQIIKLSEQLPSALDKLKNTMQTHPIGKMVFSGNQGSVSSIPSGSIGYVTSFFSSSFSFITDLLIIIIIGIYLAASPGIYLNGIKLLFPSEKQNQVTILFNNWDNALKWWLVGRFASMLIVGILIGIGLSIAGMDLAISIAIIAGILSFIPFIGPIISYIPAVLLAFADSTTMAFYVTIVFIAVQSVESYLLTPMIEKRVVSLPPALVITMQFAMGFLFGIFGVLLATPIAVVIIILIQIVYIRGVLGHEIELISKTES